MKKGLSYYLGDRSFWRVTLTLAFPIALQNLLTSSFTLVDTIMLGSLGDVPLAAVGMAGQLSWMMNLVLFGFNSGASVFFAQFWGSKDKHGIHRAFGLAMCSVLVAGLLFTLAGSLMPEQVLRLFTSDEQAIPYGVTYLRIACISYFGICLNNLLCTLLRSTECVKLPLWASAVSVAANALLNALFIYALDMGVAGAAIATAISAWISPVVILLLARRQNTILRGLHFRDIFGWGSDFVRRYFRISLPVLLNESLWGLGTVCFKLIFSNLSTEFYAAYTIFLSVEGIFFSFFVGMCHACAVVVGKRIGSGDLEDGYHTARRFMLLEPLLALIAFVLIMCTRDVLLLPFANVTTDTRDTARLLLFLYAIENVLRNIPYVSIVGIFRAGGDTKTGLLYDMGCLWLLALPVTWLLAYVVRLPLPTVFIIMLLVEDLPKSILCFVHFFKRTWIRPIASPETEQA